MNDDAEVLKFTNRKEYRAWLMKNHGREAGIWITFVKGDKQFTAKDALEESICFGRMEEEENPLTRIHNVYILL